MPTYVQREIQQIIATVLRVDVACITPKSLIQDLGADETDIAAIVTMMEEKFEISIDEGTIKLMKFVQDFIDQVPKEHE